MSLLTKQASRLRPRPGAGTPCCARALGRTSAAEAVVPQSGLCPPSKRLCGFSPGFGGGLRDQRRPKHDERSVLELGLGPLPSPVPQVCQTRERMCSPHEHALSNGRCNGHSLGAGDPQCGQHGAAPQHSPVSPVRAHRPPTSTGWKRHTLAPFTFLAPWSQQVAKILANGT